SVSQASSRYQQAEGQFRGTSDEHGSHNDDKFQNSNRDRIIQAKLDADDVKQEDFTKRSRSQSPVNSTNYEEDRRLETWGKESEKNEAKENDNTDNVGRNITRSRDQPTAQPIN